MSLNLTNNKLSEKPLIKEDLFMSRPQDGEIKEMFLTLGYSCNCNCIHCFVPYVDNPYDKDREEINKELETARNSNSNRITLTGGEPTIRDDLFPIIEDCQEKGFDMVQLQTNGRMLSYPQFCRKLFEAGITGFVVSIQGSRPEIHDKVTQVPGSFQETKAGLENLVKMRKEYGLQDDRVVTNTVITDYNCQDLPQLVSLLHKLGINAIELEYPRIIGNMKRNVDHLSSREESSRWIRKGVERAEELGIDIIYIDDFPLCQSQGFAHRNAYLLDSEQSYEEMSMRDFTEEVVDTEDHDRERAPKCEECAAKSICPGDWPEYRRHFGQEELKPMDEKQFKSLVGTSSHGD